MSVERSPIRSLVDPEGTLPDIALVPRKELCTERLEILERGGEVSEEYSIVHQDQVIGGAEILSTQQSKTVDNCFVGIWLDDEYLGKGMGMAAYVCAIELAQNRNESFESDHLLSPSALQVWQRLVEIGVAKELKEPEPSHDIDNFYEGCYIVRQSSIENQN